MRKWTIETPAAARSGRRTRRRAAAERMLGRARAAALTREFSVARALGHRLTSTGRSSASKLSMLRNQHVGDQCVVIGNGPSLNRTDLNLLRDVDTFGLNRLYLKFDELGFGTTYHVVVNQYVVEQCASELVAVPGRLFTTWPSRAPLGSRDDLVVLDKLVGPLFSKDPRRGIWEGATVTFVALQLAYWLGYEEVILIGVDHRFSTKGPAHQLVTSSGHDPNHFDPAYFGQGFKWQLPDLVTSEIAYDLARQAFVTDGRRVLDATVDGDLSVFPKTTLESALRK